MNELIEKAQKRLNELQAEVEKLRTFLGVAADLAGDKAVDNGSAKDSVKLPLRHASPKQIVESAKLAMRQQARPLTRSQLVTLLSEAGLSLGGKDKAKNIGTVIWRSDEFEQIEGLGYWPKEFGRWMGQKHASETRDLLD